MGFVITESEWAKMTTEEYSESVKSNGEKDGMTTAFFKDVESAKIGSVTRAKQTKQLK